MNIQELATCADNGIAVKVFIMNNGYLGMVRQWQELFWDRRYSQVDMGGNPGLRQARRGLRLHRHAPDRQGRRCVDDIKRGARDAGPGASSTSASRAEENVYPMIAPGAAARDMVG